MVVVLDDPAAVAREAAARVAALAAEAAAARGRVALALSGGATPRALFERLAAAPAALPWNRADVFWADERGVPPDHPDSNYRMAKATLLDPLGLPPERVHRMAGEARDLERAAAAYEALMARVLGGTPGGAPPALDVVLLGMGADGHTASLFPGTAALRERRRWVVAHQVPSHDAWRLTLTYPVLDAARAVLFLVTGIEKAATLRAVLEDPPDPERLPAQGVRPAGGPVWLVDRAAAARLAPARIGHA